MYMLLEQIKLLFIDFFDEKDIHLLKNAESKEYQAAQLRLGSWYVHFRKAKNTPIKIGQFVTFWKRSNNRLIVPFDEIDEFDFLFVFVENNDNKGLFIFPKVLLLKQKIVSVFGKGGKRAMRVYPAWDKTNSKQAQATQAWQLSYFFTIDQRNKFCSRRYEVLKKIVYS